jgi:hypothetical protein
MIDITPQVIDYTVRELANCLTIACLGGLIAWPIINYLVKDWRVK